jgi:lysophospholipase L1-like esterase
MKRAEKFYKTAPVSIVLLFLGCIIFDYGNDIDFRVEVLNSEIDKLCKSYNLKVIDTYSIYLRINDTPDPSYFYKDGLHLSKKGYENWINNALLPFLSTQNFQKIVMVGNSLTAMIEGFDFGNTVDTISNWEYLLNVKTYNAGVGGNTTYDIIDRLDAIDSHKADCYFLLIGINDIGKGVPLWKIIENIEVIVNKLTSDNSRIVLQYVMPTYEVEDM